MQLMKSCKIYVDGVELAKPKFAIGCHPFIINIGLMNGVVEYSFANAKVEELAKKHKQMERLGNLLSEIKNRFQRNYDDLQLSMELVNIIEHDLNKLMQSVRAKYPDFDQFYRESLHS